jgi:hypothetical protein
MMEECMLTALAEAEGTPRPMTQAQWYGDAKPPLVWGPSNSLSGRPTCRIYRLDTAWILQLDKNSAWIPNAIGPGTYRTFKTLGAAIRFADRYGLDYRILPGRPFLIRKARKRNGWRPLRYQGDVK